MALRLQFFDLRGRGGETLDPPVGMDLQDLSMFDRIEAANPDYHRDGAFAGEDRDVAKPAANLADERLGPAEIG